MPSLSSLNLLVTEEPWKKERKQTNVWYISHWVLYCVCTFFLRKAFFISSYTHWYRIISHIDGFLYSQQLFAWQFTDFVRRSSKDFDHFCKLMDQKTSKLICSNYDINNSFDVHTDFCCSLNTGGSVAEWLEHPIWNLEVTWSKSCSRCSCSNPVLTASWCCSW